MNRVEIRVQKKVRTRWIRTFSGERGIRTPGGVTLNGFQDRRDRPLRHLSKILL